MIAPLRFALLGDPVAHSKSPAMHEAAFRALRLPHRYEAVRCTERELPTWVDALRRGELGGLNVTIPHKRAVLAFVDDVDESAARAGAANTLVRVPRAGGDRVVAHNTDVGALAHELRRLAPEQRTGTGRHGTAIVLGGGGAARSAIVALERELDVTRIHVRVRNPSTELATDLAALAPECTLELAPLEPRPDVEPAARFVVQATSAGMDGAAPGEAVARAVAWEALGPRAAALDVVYAPPDTPFVRAATEHGLRVTAGLGMLAWQGALAFERWLGVPAPFDAMLAALQRGKR